jgi:hypothetical protein
VEEKFIFPVSRLKPGVIYSFAVPIPDTCQYQFVTFQILYEKASQSDGQKVLGIQNMARTVKRETCVMMAKKCFTCPDDDFEVFLYRSMGSNLHDLLFTNRKYDNFSDEQRKGDGAIKNMAIIELVIVAHTM